MSKALETSGSKQDLSTMLQNLYLIKGCSAPPLGDRAGLEELRVPISMPTDHVCSTETGQMGMEAHLQLLQGGSVRGSPVDLYLPSLRASGTIYARGRLATRRGCTISSAKLLSPLGRHHIFWNRIRRLQLNKLFHNYCSA